jgi:pterin-4a-carbinolamine dehydratase
MKLKCYFHKSPSGRVKEVDAVKRLERVYKFKNFAQALEFTIKVGAIALPRKKTTIH